MKNYWLDKQIPEKITDKITIEWGKPIALECVVTINCSCTSESFLSKFPPPKVISPQVNITEKDLTFTPQQQDIVIPHIDGHWDNLKLDIGDCNVPSEIKLTSVDIPGEIVVTLPKKDEQLTFAWHEI